MAQQIERTSAASVGERLERNGGIENFADDGGETLGVFVGQGSEVGERSAAHFDERIIDGVIYKIKSRGDRFV